MKPQSERTLILAGSLFLAGLIIADVITQHLNQQEASRNENAYAASLVSTDSISTEQEDKPAEPSHVQETEPVQVETDESKPISQPEPKPDANDEELFTVESAPPPPIEPESTVSEEEIELPFDHPGFEGKYQYITSSIPQTQFNIFYNALNPHGRWFRHSNHGTCWIPRESQINPQWRPYLNDGKWTYTKGGWLWRSDYRWGGYPFHFGRWFHTSKGWAWKPEGDWSTAWVSWRNAGEYCGWAPMPPVDSGEEPSDSSQKSSRKPKVSSSYHALLSEDHYVFLKKKNLLDTSLHSKVLKAEKAGSVYRHSQPADRFVRGRNLRIGNHGIPANDVMARIRLSQQKELTAKKSGSSASNSNRSNQGQDALRNVQNPQAFIQRPNGQVMRVAPSLPISSQISGPGSAEVQSPSHDDLNLPVVRQNQMNKIHQAEQTRSLPGRVHKPLTNTPRR